MEYTDFLILGVGHYIYQTVKRKIKKRKNSIRPQTASISNSVSPEEISSDATSTNNRDDERREDSEKSLNYLQEQPRKENQGEGRSDSNINVDKVKGVLLAGSPINISTNGKNSKVTGLEYVEKQLVIHIHASEPTQEPDAGRKSSSIQESRKIFDSRDQKIMMELSANLNVTRESRTNYIFPFKSNETISYEFDDIYINLLIETKNSSSLSGDKIHIIRPKRFLISGEYGSGKTTFIFKTIRDIALKICPYIQNYSNVPIIIYCDLSNYENTLKEKSVHDILMHFCRNYHPDVTEELLTICSNNIICFLNGFDSLSKPSQEKILQFFKRDSIEDPSPFCFSTLFLASSTLKITNHLYIDKTITMKGMPRESSFTLVGKIFGENTAEKDVFLSQLRTLDLMFLLEMSPWMVHCACHVHDRIKGSSRGRYLRSLLRLLVKEYILKQNTKLTQDNRQLTDTISRIGEIVYNQSQNLACSSINDNDLKMILALGWLKLNDDQTFVPTYPILLEAIIVQYLNYSIAKLKLEEQIQRFKSEFEHNVDAVVDFSNAYYLKHMFVTHRDKLFVLSLSTENQYEYCVKFHIYRDFQELIEGKVSYYSIDITKMEGTQIENLPLLSPIPFTGEHFLIDLLGFTCSEILISLKFVNSGNGSSDHTLTLCSYGIRGEDCGLEFRYQLRTYRVDVFPIANFVKGVNAILLTWNLKGFPFFVANISIVSDMKNEAFSSRVLKILLGFDASHEDSAGNTQSLLRNLENYMNSRYEPETFFLQVENDFLLKAILVCTRLNFLISPNSKLSFDNARGDRHLTKFRTLYRKKILKILKST